jgi:hypothetical protein
LERGRVGARVEEQVLDAVLVEEHQQVLGGRPEVEVVVHGFSFTGMRLISGPPQACEIARR